MEVTSILNGDVFVMYLNGNPILLINNFSNVKSAKVEKHTEKIYLQGSNLSIEWHLLEVSLKSEYNAISYKFGSQQEANDAIGCIIKSIEGTNEVKDIDHEQH